MFPYEAQILQLNSPFQIQNLEYGLRYQTICAVRFFSCSRTAERDWDARKAMEEKGEFCKAQETHDELSPKKLTRVDRSRGLARASAINSIALTRVTSNTTRCTLTTSRWPARARSTCS